MPQWTPEEFVMALDAFLRGRGLQRVCEVTGRQLHAVENVLLSDIPRNYRNCINKWIAPARLELTRDKEPWSNNELKFLGLLWAHHKMPGSTVGQHEICVVLGRSWESIQEQLSKLIISQPKTEGFF